MGWPVGHSKSPDMHNAAFRAAGIDGFYALLPVDPERVGEAVRGVRALGMRGVNVTVPHKQAVIPYLDELTPEAEAIGAVNTIIVANDRLVGTNTDAWGFWQDLEDVGAVDSLSDHDSALVLGAGGSARAVVYALARHGISTHILARRPDQARSLALELAPHLSQPRLIAAHAWDELAILAPEMKLIVNCTPVGMSPNVHLSPWPDNVPILPQQMVYDLVYNPPITKFMEQARVAGAQAWNGLGMLVQQGARAWQLWTGYEPPVAVMRSAVGM